MKAPVKVVTVCVNYSDFLDLTLRNNIKILEKITIVTTPNDKDTQDVCKKWGANIILSNACYEDNAPFNKSKMINLALKKIYDSGYNGWVIHTDADILFDPNLTEILDFENIDPRFLYSAHRYYIRTEEALNAYKDGEGYNFNKLREDYIDYKEFSMGCGYFQLFHSKHKRLYNEEFLAADKSDEWFKNSFGRAISTSYFVSHLGEDGGLNWRGRTTERWRT